MLRLEDTTTSKKDNKQWRVPLKNDDSTEVKKPLQFGLLSFTEKPIASENKNVFSMFKLDPSSVQNLDDVCKITGLSKELVTTIMDSEGLRLKAYKDSGGISTIGYGHNIDKDPDYCFGKTITKQQAFYLLTKDLLKTKKDLVALTAGTKLNQNQNEVMLDILYNVHPRSLIKTDIFGSIQRGKLNEVPRKMVFVNDAKGNFCPGLGLRRLKNISKFTRENPSPETLDAMKTLYNKGVISLNGKIQATKDKTAKKNLLGQKNYFVYAGKKIINESTSNFYILKRKPKKGKKKAGGLED